MIEGSRCNSFKAGVIRASGLLATLTLLSLTSASSLAASVESLSNDVLVHQGENAYWQANVKCEGSSTEIPIRQERQQQDWCAETSLLPCAQSKLEMANQVCLNIDVFETVSPVASPQPAPTRSEPPTPSREETERANRQRQAQAELAAAIRAEEQELQQERRQLESERRLVDQADRELTEQERQLEAQLRELEN